MLVYNIEVSLLSQSCVDVCLMQIHSSHICVCVHPNTSTCMSQNDTEPFSVVGRDRVSEGAQVQGSFMDIKFYLNINKIYNSNINKVLNFKHSQGIRFITPEQEILCLFREEQDRGWPNSPTFLCPSRMWVRV